MSTSETIWQHTTCDGCGKPFANEREYADRSTPHEPGCPGEGCDCDLNYHDACYDRIIVECPRCGEEQEDFDGFGVVHCEACGYCTHPSCEVIDGKAVCGICGNVAEVAS